ncbi:MAG: winged helix-turn-helix domain-containing protein, partial [Actinobacteria bacterium]|nr:winged helix-turn-helix domain-containing protein [Actinomycetota bacterium]
MVAQAAGVEIDLGPKQQRRLLATLAMHRGRSLSTAAIAEAMWDEPPASHVVTLQGYVSGLRKALEPSREARRSGRIIVTTSTGYMLTLDAEELDADRFESAVRRAGEVFSVRSDRPWQPSLPVTSAQCAEARAELEAALSLWRGEPYAELGSALAAQSARAGLEELRVYAVELSAAIGIALGAGAEALTRLETLSAVHPHRESLAMLKAVALVRLGRQVDALAWLRQWRERLLEDQGLDPSEAMRELESAVLQQRLAPVVLADPPAQRIAEAPQAAAAGHPDPDPVDAPSEIRVGIVDDHPVFRMGLRGLLSCIPGLRVVGEAGDPGEAERLVS